MKKGRVYWITGLPGSGKTTIGTALYYDLREKQDNVIILDGDILKKFVGDSIGYSEEDRYVRAKKYANICKLLSDQGMCVIICTVALFDSIREWNRKNINGYVEVFLDVPLEVLKKRNKKGLYSGKTKDEVLDNVEFPTDPDVRIVNNDNTIIEDFVREIEFVSPRIESDFDRDKEYWNQIYKDSFITQEPSPFAKDVISDMLLRGGDLLELGCGNGRDSLYFAKKGLRVTGIDASNIVIDELNAATKKANNVRFICDDFVRCKSVYSVMYDSIYSRFTLHAINEKQEDELLHNCASALKKGGRIYIEARSVRDDLYGKGEKIGKNEFVYNEHYRRFVEIDILIQKLENLGLQIVSKSEGRGFSTTVNQDPVLIRVVAEHK